MQIHKYSLLTGLFFFPVVAALAQQTGNSPFSRFGLGDIHREGSVRNLGMGGIGTGYADTVYLNFVNPAMVSFNKFTVFDAGFYHQTRTLSQEGRSQTNRGGNLNHIVLGLPMTKWWSSVLGLNRYSSVNLRFQTVENISNDPSDGTFSKRINSSGGLTRLLFSNGFAITQKWRFGVQTAYYFGDIFSEDAYVLNGALNTGDFLVLTDQYRLRHWGYKAGLAFVDRLGKSKSILFSTGLSAEVGQKIKAEYTSSLERIRGGDIVAQDMVVRDQPVRYQPPATYRWGVGLQRAGKWGLGFDAEYSSWSQFELQGRNGNLADSYGGTFGGEWTPNRNAIGRAGLLKRASYRAAVYYQNTHLLINNEQVPDFGINFGVSLPVKRLISRLEYNYAVSTLNLAVQIGNRGIAGERNLTERYVGITLGMSILDKWFERYRYD